MNGKEFKTNDKRQKYCSKKCYLDDRVIDLTGQKFGKLTVLGLGYKEPKKVYWLCECECGNKRYLTNGHLRTMVSCGCVMAEKQKV